MIYEIKENSCSCTTHYIQDGIDKKCSQQIRLIIIVEI